MIGHLASSSAFCPQDSRTAFREAAAMADLVTHRVVDLAVASEYRVGQAYLGHPAEDPACVGPVDLEVLFLDQSLPRTQARPKFCSPDQVAKELCVHRPEVV